MNSVRIPGVLAIAFTAIGLSPAAMAAVQPPYAPAFQFVPSPPATPDFGEPSIAFNPESKRGMFQSGLLTLRYTLPENRQDDELNPDGLPEACDTQWEDVSPPNQTTTLDPIGLGDPTTGRYFASQLAVKSALTNFTDDDGATWTSATGGFPGAAGVDHQTVGWGPYVAGGLARPLTPYPNAIYYCSQDSDNIEGRLQAPFQAGDATAGYTNCSRSDDGGQSFLPPVTVHTTVDCGGLTGHIRAAPDGTVYLPNRDCTTAQGVAVSEDNGTTWAVRRIAGSIPGSTDPAIALAADGTGYFCYANGDGHPHVAVTHDRGKTWAHDTDLGLAVGVINSVFPEATAGDANRAACGFLGSDAPGNHDSMDFPGAWYAYIAVTYDGGLTWSTTNVTPGDRVQGPGGICTLGQGCGSNRNLLDFNDMTIDDRGRPLMGFADGCPGNVCVGAAKASIARAVGGQSLYAALDRAEPHAPQAACLSGGRDEASAWLTWRKPAFDGASPVTGYRVYRSTAPTAAGTLIASVGAQQDFYDGNTDAAVPDYYYTVVALNAAGASVHSNLIRLSIGSGPRLETPCFAPGVTILNDPEGDANDNRSASDLSRLSVSQPARGDGDYKLYFHLKVGSLATVPAGQVWAANFCSPAFPCVNPDAATQAYGADNQYYTVEMSTVAPASAAAPAFQVRQPGAGVSAAAARAVVPALAESKFGSDGLITIAVNASDLGLAAGGAGTDRLSKFQAQVAMRTSTGGLTIDSISDTMPDDSVGTGEFATQVLDACVVNTPPLAALSASPGAGPPPLEVAFDAAASSDAEDAIASYTFDFGDGSDSVTQPGAGISHTFADIGTYTVTLTVTDARGLVSPVPATRTISVGIPETPKLTNTFMGGGALPAGILAFGLLGLLRKARKR